MPEVVPVSVLWAEGRGRPEFLATASPSLSWRVTTDLPNWVQKGFTLDCRTNAGTTSVKVSTGNSQHVPWPFEPLTAYDSVDVRVHVDGLSDAGEGPTPSTASPSAWITLRTGPLSVADWTADFIAAEPTGAEPDESRGTSLFRSVFSPRSDVATAILSISSHGIYEATLNGETIGDEVLTPGWTSYDARLTFQSFDVTAGVRSGRNVLGATVADGWYGERFGFDGNFSRSYVGPRALTAQLRITYADGTSEMITTDATWSAATNGPVCRAGIYPGEHYDARLETAALSDPDTDFVNSVRATVIGADASRLTPSFAPPVRRIERVAARKIFTTPAGKTVIDFGQNLVGWLEIRVDAPEGHTVTLRHAEVLEDGELGVRPLRFAEATDSFTGCGDGVRTWSPRFTFHGFRYAEIENWPGELSIDDVTAVVIHNDMVRTGALETSNPKLNQLHQNVLWGMRGNFLSLPTDCPQRDERLGWTGDIQVFAPTASYLYDVSGFLGSWLRDVDLDQQRADGVVPFVVPNPLPMPPLAAAAWGDAATLVPDTLFTRYGDSAALNHQYSSMRSWVETVAALAGDNYLWTGGFQFGDWLDPSAPPENPAQAKTDSDIVATAYFFHSTARLAAAATELGHEDDARRFADLAERIRSAFLREYVTPAGRIVSDAHTAYALALAFRIVVEPDMVALAGARLGELVRAHGFRIGTGFVGTPLIADALCLGGQSDVAYRLLLEEGCPSWLYPISMGATTIWERWDSMLPDGSINPGEMTSFNHYALGAVADWMHRAIGGIAPAEPGYRTIEIAPILGGGLTSSTASLDTGYGTVSVEWSLKGTTLSVRAVVPPNTQARVVLPGRDAEVVGSGTHEWTTNAASVLTDAARPVYSLESSLADIVTDADARAAVEGAFADLGYFIGLGWTSGGKWKSDSTLADALIMFPPEGLTHLHEVFARLNAR
ncbi:alpha-L-rhamnosidase [Okibacterium sp. HSC-33S16]|uniref:alpha-L-rhamnosidase n=1 Tax=Okibacterium sp. HSC-33S16 TaxID=2910965 RepID=UPI00209FED50|nr:alpha-L-rhamnosidase [Okibacterium sp. HSC-33S16]MCP2031171.1 alpha-L-rhamnosidase [Okibacterium sp. HSC-33S16]